MFVEISGLEENRLLGGLMSLASGEESEESSGHSSLGPDHWEQESLICSKHKGPVILLTFSYHFGCSTIY